MEEEEHDEPLLDALTVLVRSEARCADQIPGDDRLGESVGDTATDNMPGPWYRLHGAPRDEVEASARRRLLAEALTIIDQLTGTESSAAP